MFTKAVATVFVSTTIGFLGYIANGVIEAKALSPRIEIVELRALTSAKEISDFKSVIREDIGYIKGQNQTIINLLKQGDRNGSTRSSFRD